MRNRALLLILLCLVALMAPYSTSSTEIGSGWWFSVGLTVENSTVPGLEVTVQRTGVIDRLVLEHSGSEPVYVGIKNVSGSTKYDDMAKAQAELPYPFVATAKLVNGTRYDYRLLQDSEQNTVSSDNSSYTWVQSPYESTYQVYGNDVQRLFDKAPWDENGSVQQINGNIVALNRPEKQDLELPESHNYSVPIWYNNSEKHVGGTVSYAYNPNYEEPNTFERRGQISMSVRSLIWLLLVLPGAVKIGSVLLYTHFRELPKKMVFVSAATYASVPALTWLIGIKHEVILVALLLAMILADTFLYWKTTPAEFTVGRAAALAVLTAVIAVGTLFGVILTFF